MKGYIYIRTNEWCELKKIYKVGITKSIKDRNNSYITGEIIRGKFIKIFELDFKDNNDKQLKYIDNIIKIKFKKLNVYFDGGTEFYDITIIDKIDEFLLKNNIKFKLVNEDELKRLNRNNNEEIIINNYLKLIKKLFILKEEQKEKDKIILRDYQITAINYIEKELIKNNKIYLCLATGAGKTQIAFNVFSKIKPLNILIFSPRIAIKNQNNKYIARLNDINSNIYNYCYQSYKNVYDLIIENNIRDLFIWFDEAHFTLDNWIIDKDNDIKQFFMNDNNYIKYRLFTTASPNKEFVINKKEIYGEFYEPIRFKELMDLGYLAKIEVEIFDREINKNNIEFNNLIFNTFNKPNQERKQGLSFHNSCINAHIYYLYHLKAFNTGKNDIKPYILINDEFIKNEKIINDDCSISEDESYQEIKKQNLIDIKKELGKNIIYYNNINEFEFEVDKNKKSIGYVVAKYSMGYDNRNIDIIYFTDYKLSYKDIIQSIGRGTRIFNDKYLRVILPTNFNNEVEKEYKKIENVLKYLLVDIELEYDKIKCYKLDKINNKDLSDKLLIKSDDYEIIEDTNEKSNINTMKHNIIVKANQWTVQKIINQLKFNNIHNIEDYNIYKDLNKKINLPNINELLEYQNFNFKDTYINEEECPYYYNKYECIEIIKTYKKELRKINRDNKKLEYLVSNDKKIPNMSLWYFYGGKRDDYY
jgi:superfamily II DNA or RNA helicase